MMQGSGRPRRRWEWTWGMVGQAGPTERGVPLRRTATLWACARPGGGWGWERRDTGPSLQTTAPAPACSLRTAATRVSGPGLAPAGRGLCQNPPCARLPPSRRPSARVPAGQSCPPPSCALCFWLMHQPDSLKQNHLLSRQDPLFLSWNQMELLRRQRSFLSPEGVEMAPRATNGHTSLVGFRDEVNRASPLKTAQVTRGDAEAHLTESSAKYSRPCQGPHRRSCLWNKAPAVCFSPALRVSAAELTCSLVAVHGLLVAWLLLLPWATAGYRALSRDSSLSGLSRKPSPPTRECTFIASWDKMVTKHLPNHARNSDWREGLQRTRPIRQFFYTRIKSSPKNQVSYPSSRCARMEFRASIWTRHFVPWENWQNRPPRDLDIFRRKFLWMFIALPHACCCFSCWIVSDSAVPWTVACRAPVSTEFSR